MLDLNYFYRLSYCADVLSGVGQFFIADVRAFVLGCAPKCNFDNSVQRELVRYWPRSPVSSRRRLREPDNDSHRDSRQ